jgi:hypothetical protein
MPPHLLNNCHQIHFSLVEKKVAGLMGRWAVNQLYILVRQAIHGSIVNFWKGLGAIRAKIGPTSDVDKNFSKMYSQYVLFRNKYSYLICVSNSSQRIDKFRYWKATNVIFFIIQNIRIIVL